MANTTLTIKTPRGCLIQTTVDGVKMQAKLEFNPNFGVTWTGRMNRAQKVMDSEVLRRSTPYVPYQTTMLRKSGILGTAIGLGEVAWIAPYAKKQYYTTSRTRTYDALCGAFWFERMKADHKHEIIRIVRRIGGGNG